MGTAWVFPGQGSQKANMADGVLDLPGAAERFALASQLVGRDLLTIYAADGNPEDINDTRHTQPALFVVESLLVDGLLAQGQQPQVVAGHSLGELVALYAAGVFDAQTGLELTRRRSSLMAAVGSGAMTAVIGCDRGQLEEIVNSTDGVVIANDNSNAQVVLSGTPEAVAEVSGALRCKRTIPLAVSGAFHSPFMQGAAAAFADHLAEVPFSDARYPVLSNAEPRPETQASVLKKRLLRQMTSPVRWRETMQRLAELQMNRAVEIGPGNVLSGLIKRSAKGIVTAQISGASDLNA